MRQLSSLVFVILTTITLFSCNRSTVSLTETNARNEIPPLGNLYFRFDKPLVPDSLLNRWDSTEFISFKPAIKGRFRWESPDQLVFSPASPFAPATNYTAELRNDLLAFSEVENVAKSEALSFYTAPLKLQNAAASWVLSQQGSQKAVPKIDLEFNYAISPAVLKEKMTVTVDDKLQELNFMNTTATRFVSLQLNNVPATDKDYNIKVNLEKGLIPDEGKNPTGEALTETLQVPSPFVLVIRGVEAQHDGLTGTVNILTSQPIASEDLKAFVRINPTTGFQVQTTEDGLQISGENFKASETYAVKLLKGLRGILGGVLKDEYEEEVGFGELEPNISFGSSKAVYMMASGERNIDIRITNIPKVKLIISKIYASNLLTAQRYGYYPADKRGNYDDEEYYGYETSSTDGTPGDIIYEKEIETRSLPKKGEGYLLHFNPEDKLPDFKGIYHIMIRSATDYWIRDSRFLAVSDIGLIAKESRDKLVVFANSLKTADAMNGVQVTAYGSNNQVLGMGTTDAQGAVEINYTRKEYAGFQPAMLIATTADDFNYLPFQSTRVNTSRFNVDGKSISLTGMDAFIYGERDIYRPGEEIHQSLVLRDKQWKSPGEIPVRFRLVMPNGKEMKNIRKMLNDEGSAEIAVPIPYEAYTGAYRLEVYSGNDILLGTKTISVEEFVPDRIKVDVAVSQTVLMPGDSASLQITAVNLFGPPAANRNYEYEMQLSQKTFRPQQFDNYTFQLTNQTNFFDKVVKEGKTDDDGKASIGISIPSIYKNMGLLEATFYSTVFDETGRPVSRTTSVDINTQDVYFGIGYDGYDYYPLKQAVRFPLIAVKKDGKPVAANAKIQIIKHDYRTILNRSDGYFRYTSQQENKILKDETISINTQNSFYTFSPQQPGDYEIRVFVPGGSTYVSRSFYSYGSRGNATAFEVDPEGRVEIETDKKTYQVGEKAKLLFKTPFNGKMLVSLENDGILSWQYVDVQERTATVELPLQFQHLPNVYITATLFKSHGVSELPLTVAHGIQSVSVQSKERKLDVKINAVATSGSRTKQQITVSTTPGAMVTLAVVDEGVLQVTDMKTPDPYHWFYQKRKLTTTSYDLYPLLFPELRARLSSTGGDGIEMKKRTNPMPAGRIKVVSYWSGIRKTGSNGEARFDVAIPGFSGSLRMMAVAYKDETFGSAEQQMRVADPLVISTGLPRFLSPGDTISLPVTITNTTKNPINGAAIVKLTGPLSVSGDPKQETTVPAGGEVRLNYKVYAEARMDTAKMRVEVSGKGVQAFEEIPIAVRPSSTLQKVSGSGTIAGNKSEKVDLPMSRFLAGTTNYRFMISSNPVTAISDQLAYLIQYPYGCTEQTVSAAFPQLYYTDLSNIGKTKTTSANAAAGNINEAIRKIKMRQLQNGGLTMWDGEGEENWWASAYAAHFLTEASRSGYEIDKSLLETLYQYLIFKLRNRQFINYYYNRDKQKKIAPKEVAYSLYVLALAGKPQSGTMNYYKSNTDWLSLDGRYTLAAAFALSGNRKSFESLLPSSFQGEVSVTQTGGSFYSPVRDEALALSVLVDTEPSNAQIPVMAKHVQDYLKSQRYLSTQERAFSFLALGKIARNGAKGNITGEIKSANKFIAAISDKTVLITDKIVSGPASFDIATKGSGQLYYSWEAEGLDITGNYIEEDKFIRVRRQFYDRYGKKISGNQFEQNQLVIVGITLENSYSSPVDNIVITDLLPAGFEIENPRTKEIPGMDWIKGASSPDALDVRDDRIHFFVDLDEKTQTYYYAVRAITPGVFRIGPVSADAMYNGEYHSYHGGGKIRITR
ncbi:alpha-2-macroglobulin [Pollutibacter soli]|uniref:alpha-2-macroglobulin family protein n=1 Tax=Pollutibacter soli TaxID=3034157 RepID=UPI003013A0A0